MYCSPEVKRPGSQLNADTLVRLSQAQARALDALLAREGLPEFAGRPIRAREIRPNRMRPHSRLARSDSVSRASLTRTCGLASQAGLRQDYRIPPGRRRATGATAMDVCARIPSFLGRWNHVKAAARAGWRAVRRQRPRAPTRIQVSSDGRATGEGPRRRTPLSQRESHHGHRRHGLPGPVSDSRSPPDEVGSPCPIASRRSSTVPGETGLPGRRRRGARLPRHCRRFFMPARVRRAMSVASRGKGIRNGGAAAPLNSVFAIA